MKTYTPAKLGAFLILVIAPIFYMTMTRDIFVMPKTIPIALGLFIMLASLAWVGNFHSNVRRLVKPIAMLLVAAAISTLFSADTPMSIFGPHGHQFHGLLPMTLCALAYYAAANADELSPRTMTNMALLGGILVCLPAFSQVTLSKYTFMDWTIQNRRAGSTFGSPVALGYYLALLLPLAWNRVLKNRFWSVAVLMLLGGIAASQSRGALVGGAAGVLLVEFLNGNRKRVALLLIGFAISAGIMFHARKAVSADIGRMELLWISAKAFKVHPVLGWGPDTFSLAFHQFMTKNFVASEGNDFSVQMSAHNDILQVLVTMGLIGFLAYVYFLINVWHLLKESVKWEPDTIGIAGLILALFVEAKFNQIPLTVFVIAAFMLGAVDRWKDFDDLEPSNRRLHVAGAAVASLALAVVFGVVLKAEYHQRQGENLWQMGYPVQAAEQFNRAAQVDPFDLWYTQRQMDYFWKVIGHMPETDREVLAAFSHNISERIARLHPADPVARELRSISYEFEGDMIFRDRYWEAYKEIEVAERLSPLFSSYARRKECIFYRMKNKDPRSCYDQGSQQAAKS